MPDRRIRPSPPSLFEMMKHPFATLNRVAQLNRMPDRRVSQKLRNYGSHAGVTDPQDPIRREARVQSIYKALGIYAIEETRTELYENYREMDTDPMIAAVMDEFAANAAQKDPETKRIIWCESQNEDIKHIVTETLDRTGMDRWAFPVNRAMARDGDVFFHVAASRGFGVVAVRPYDPWVVARIEDDIGRLVGFAAADEQGQPSAEDRTAVPHYRALHFRLPPRELTDSYGATSSYLWGSRIVWRQLQLMEDQVVLQRLLRRPDRLIVLMDTTGMSHDEAWMTIKDYERRLHREWFMNQNQSAFQSHGTPLDPAKDVVLPRGKNNETEITNYPATNQNDILKDVDLFLARLAAGIGFPLGFIGRGDPGSYIPGQSLARQSEPFSARTAALQDAFLPEVLRMCIIDLAYKGLNPYAEQNAFTLNMSTVSPIRDIERNELIQLKTDRLERAVAFGRNAGLDLDVWIPYCLERYGGFSRALIDELYYPGTEIPGDPTRWTIFPPQAAPSPAQKAPNITMRGVLGQTTGAMSEMARADPRLPDNVQLDESKARALREEGANYREIALELGVSYGSVRELFRGKNGRRMSPELLAEADHHVGSVLPKQDMTKSVSSSAAVNLGNMNEDSLAELVPSGSNGGGDYRDLSESAVNKRKDQVNENLADGFEKNEKGKKVVAGQISDDQIQLVDEKRKEIRARAKDTRVKLMSGLADGRLIL